MEYIRSGRRAIFLVSLCLSLSACAVPSGVEVPVPEAPWGKIEKPIISERLSTVSSVAVLPFKLVQGESQGAEVVRRSFYNHLSSKTFHDMELHRVDAALRTKGIQSADDLASMTPQEIAALLQVDALIYGEVLDFSRYFAAVASGVRVGMHVTMKDGRDGTVLWEVAHTGLSSEWSFPTIDPITLATTIIGAALHVREVQLLRDTDDLCRRIIETLPGPTLSAAFKPPAITALVQDAWDAPKKAGDVIKVVMLGDPGYHAVFHLGSFRQHLPMAEDPAGTYIGSYQVQPGDNVQQAIVEGQLTDERGNQSRWLDVRGSVTIDTLPPATPHGLEATGRDTAVVLRWQANPEADLTGYRLYRSESPLTGYRPMHQVEVTEVRDTDLTNFQRYYYKVSAVDQAGNESTPSGAVAGLAVKSGPTPVTEDITDDTTWYAGASPYMLRHPITVRTGATLTIEPGVIIESAGPGLYIRGKLLAVGKQDALIVFRAEPQHAVESRWEGLTFDNIGTSQNRLVHVTIRDAQVGIRAISSSPEIRHTSLTQNGTALFLTDFSAPHIEANTITGNHQDGVVIRHAAPILVRNDITFNGGNGITLAASTPVLTENNVHSNRQRQLIIEEGGAAIINAQNNWWGTTDRVQLTQQIVGPASYVKILDGPYPEGQPVTLPALAQDRSLSTPALLPPTSMSADALAAQAQAALKQGHLQDALVAFQQALALQPTNDRLLFQIGVIHYQRGEFDATLASMQKATTLQPDNLEYHYHLGLVYSELGEAERAIEAWQHVLKIDPGHANARLLLELEQRQRN
jgi:hypothetical protein